MLRLFFWTDIDIKEISLTLILPRTRFSDPLQFGDNYFNSEIDDSKLKLSDKIYLSRKNLDHFTPWMFQITHVATSTYQRAPIACYFDYVYV